MAKLDPQQIQANVQAILQAGGGRQDVENYLKSGGIGYTVNTSQGPEPSEVDSRSNAWSELKKEIMYTPQANKDASFGERMNFMQGPVLAAKAYGALAQSAEGAVAAPAVRALQGDWNIPKNMYRGATVQDKSQLGDIGRELGIPNIPTPLGDVDPSAIAGLALAPDPLHLSRIATVGRKSLQEAITRGTKKGFAGWKTYVGEQLGKPKSALDYLSNTRWKAVRGEAGKFNLDPNAAQTFADSLTHVAETKVMKPASEAYGAALGKVLNEELPSAKAFVYKAKKLVRGSEGALDPLRTKLEANLDALTARIKESEDAKVLLKQFKESPELAASAGIMPEDLVAAQKASVVTVRDALDIISSNEQNTRSVLASKVSEVAKNHLADHFEDYAKAKSFYADAKDLERSLKIATRGAAEELPDEMGNIAKKGNTLIKYFNPGEKELQKSVEAVDVILSKYGHTKTGEVIDKVKDIAAASGYGSIKTRMFPMTLAGGAMGALGRMGVINPVLGGTALVGSLAEATPRINALSSEAAYRTHEFLTGPGMSKTRDWLEKYPMRHLADKGVARASAGLYNNSSE